MIAHLAIAIAALAGSDYPPSGTGPDTPPPTTVTAQRDALADTGGDYGDELRIGAVAVVAGLGLLAVSRRRGVPS